MKTAEMAARYMRGDTLRQIGKEAGVSGTTVHYHLKKLGMNFRTGGHPRNDKILIDAVKNLRKQGLSFGRIAKMTGRTRGTIAGVDWRHCK